MFKTLIFLLLSLFISFSLKASHVMGGEITWKCQGVNYVFELTFYRDCNGADVNTVSETIKVWNHASVNEIIVNFVSRTDISPTCTPVLGSPPPLSCGSGTSGGNGVGAIEKVVYRSNPISLTGTPPTSGWIFTFENFARSAAITNLVDPSNTGITIVAYMFQNMTSASGCVDNSPRFLQDPFLVSCAGSPYVYNMNPVDDDLDSLVIEFGHPLNNFGSGTFSPPTNPTELVFETGFSATSPTPNTSFNAGNIPATLNQTSGELKFTSFTTGNFVVKIIVKSYRQGVLIAQVEREMQLVVSNCLPTNNAPIINGPFAGSFETTVFAGDLVNFQLLAQDAEWLQDGSEQENSLTASGQMFGTNFTQTTGCDIAPCATLSQTTPITDNLGVSTTFNWQTDCDHLVNQYGIVASEIPYNFVFRVQDNYCQVPKVSYVTITINVKNKDIIPPSQIECISTLNNGDLNISWTQATDPNSAFIRYELHSVQNGLIASFPSILTISTVVPAVNDNHDFYLVTVSGCDGNVALSSDTVSNIYLELFNPANGTAVLTWNDPFDVLQSGTNAYYHIYREYPSGSWTLIDSIEVAGTNQFRDTIDVCESFLNYQLVLETETCSHTSNIKGDLFEDMITPDIPLIQSVSIDTLTGQVTVTWNVNNQDDTYGYVVYMADPDGVLFEVDTVWGISNVTYTFGPNTSLGSLVFSIAAFDSCFTTQIPPTYQTSAKSTLHRTSFLSSTYSVCDRMLSLYWTPYTGWSGVEAYEIYGRKVGTPWLQLGTTTSLFFTTQLDNLENYEFAVLAKELNGINQSFSNKINVVAVSPSLPDFHYTKYVSVDEQSIELKHYIDASAGVNELLVERKNREGIFVPIANISVTSDDAFFVDDEVDVNRFSYTYRVKIIDSCGNEGAIANEVSTILLEVQTDQISRVNYLTWSPYIGFNGGVLNYFVYRAINNNWDPNAIAVLPSTTLHFLDSLEDESLVSGQVCYRIVAVEGASIYPTTEVSNSNTVCPVFEPVIFIPNTFTPDGDGLNETFKPIISFAEPQDYEFTIVNRWGTIVWKTNDLNEGWDGSVQGTNQLAETGTYMYVLLVKDGNKQEISRRGFVNILK